MRSTTLDRRTGAHPSGPASLPLTPTSNTDSLFHVSVLPLRPSCGTGGDLCPNQQAVETSVRPSRPWDHVFRTVSSTAFAYIRIKVLPVGKQSAVSSWLGK